jgi:hypothetical protein
LHRPFASIPTERLPTATGVMLCWEIRGLMKRAKFIDAIVADPYNQTSWNGFRNWTTRTKLTANWLTLKEGVSVENRMGTQISQ